MFGYKFINEEDYYNLKRIINNKNIENQKLQRKLDNLKHGIKEILAKQAVAHTLEIGYKIKEDGTSQSCPGS